MTSDELDLATAVVYATAYNRAYAKYTRDQVFLHTPTPEDETAWEDVQAVKALADAQEAVQRFLRARATNPN